MKTLLSIFALCALLLVGCSKNDVLENVSQNEGQLLFSTLLGKQTKAAELTNDGLKQLANSNSINAIKLIAYHNQAGIWGKWFDDNLWYNGNGWQISTSRFRNTSPTKYVSLHPQANIDVSISGSGLDNADFITTFPRFGYTVRDAQVDQEDLIAGIVDLGANQTDVLLKMRHLLSQINFGVKTYAGTRVTIANIQVKAVRNSAVFTFGATDSYPLGNWTLDSNKSHDYAYQFGLTSEYTTPSNARTGDKYIFGDGGNWGAGMKSDTWYVLSDGTEKLSTDVTVGDKLANSLMLIPQSLPAGTTEAYVTFSYKIQDEQGAYIVGSPTTYVNGVFDLNFDNGTTSGTNYLGKWEQNNRYIYLIDFSSFLEDNQMTWRVDVDSAPWENHNGAGANNGATDIAIVGQPTEAIIDALTNSSIYYPVSNSNIAPVNQYAQLVNDQVWYWDLYTYAGINSHGNRLIIDFKNVIFNGNKIDIILPTGYISTTGYTGQITVMGQQLTIINTMDHVFATATELKNGFERNIHDKFFFTGNGATVNLDSFYTTNSNGMIKFLDTPPANAATLSKWIWDPVTKIASVKR